MNILYLNNHLNIGGISSYVLILGTGLKERGHNVYVASSGGQWRERFLKEGINHIPIPIRTKKELSPKILISAFKLSEVVKKYDIDILHSHSRTTQVLGCLLSRMAKIPHIWTCHGFFKKRFLRRMFPCWGQKVIAISESVREHLLQDFKVKEENIVVIHNGINIERFRRTTNNEQRTTKSNLGLKEGPVVGIVARLSEEKGHSYLIEAMKEVIGKIPQAQLLIVGEGRMKEELLQRVSELEMSKKVFFLPAVEDTASVLSAMDLFVLPSLKEGLGLSLMEAQAAGLAVIGSEVGGIKSLIQDGLTGLLVKPRDTPALSSAILALLKDAQKRQSLGKQAQINICENFSQEKMVLKTERLYLECLNARYRQ